MLNFPVPKDPLSPHAARPMPHSYLISTSLVAPGLESKNFPELWREAERANAGWGVTGTVVFDGAIFLQYLEGPKSGLDVIYRRLLRASSHRDTTIIDRGLTSYRRFPEPRLVTVTPEAMAQALKLRGFLFRRRGRAARALHLLEQTVTSYSSPHWAAQSKL
ncbi:BLUF domain-containing protein [Stenotrophomonas sp.]|uniref:BLUF domain-containing protein n=1 Tax=Stenotrophomonas sp. TaxID=69392 RepID=UPI0028AC501A|nr:BLUF domain-containing protein [Stenotrophomonas sp.]